MSKDTALYRFFDAENDLLYIGITHRLEGRLAQHKRVKPWGEVASITLEWHSSRRDAIAAEVEAIQAERPRWNVKHQNGAVHARYDGAAGGLVGQFFHIRKFHGDGCVTIDRQGEVLERIADDIYLVGYFEWTMGSPTDGNELIAIDDMLGWLFYVDDETMRYAYEYEWQDGMQHYEHHQDD